MIGKLNRGGPFKSQDHERKLIGRIAGVSVLLAVLASAARAGVVGDGTDFQVDTRPHYVTSDGSGTHKTTAGTDAFGVNHDGVAELIIDRTDGTFRCSGALLKDGRSVATAGHCLTNDTGDENTNQVTATWELDDKDVSMSTTKVSAHPDFNGETVDGFDGGGGGAIRSPLSDEIPRYELLRNDDNKALSDELNKKTIKIGYGRSGRGDTGDTLSGGTKRSGLNEWEEDGIIGGTDNRDTKLTYDFDANFRNLSNDGGKDEDDDKQHDAFHQHLGFAHDLGFGDDEVGSAGGDSGARASSRKMENFESLGSVLMDSESMGRVTSMAI